MRPANLTASISMTLLLIRSYNPVFGFQLSPIRILSRGSRCSPCTTTERYQSSIAIDDDDSSPQDMTSSSTAPTPTSVSTATIELYDSATIQQRVFATADQRPVILFDGVCNMCNSAVNLALDWDPKGKLRFAALQSNVGRALLEVNGRQADDISSIVLVTKNGAYLKSDAVLKITEELTPFSALLPLKPAAALGRFVIPKVLRDVLYDGVADNRYRVMGKRMECRFDADGEFEDRFVDDQIAVRPIGVST